ncbi:MAG: GNAT family N-acetyltransferase [Lachnospiraceae bacterium]|nr:GNAT family N-acetyltransferase [Lachnospiraceae bacterium]
MNWIDKTFEELTSRELYEILKSRAEVFVKEQNISYVDEDDVDYRSLHIFLMDDGRVVAYLRAYQDADGTIKIGRVLTLVHGRGLGTELMKHAIKTISEKMDCKIIRMDAQKRAVEFYRRLGFSVDSEEYLEEGIPHVDMSLKISAEITL